MEKAAIDHQELNFLRQRDTVKTWTNASANPTSLSNAMDVYADILEDIEGFESFVKSKFPFRTLFFQQSFLANSMNDQMAHKNLGLSCLHFVLERTHNEVGKLDLEHVVNSGKSKGYFQTQEHYDRTLCIAQTVGDCLEATSPSEFVSAVLKPNCRQTARMIIDLGLLTLESCTLTAQEIFTGSCLVLSELKLNGQFSDWMTSYFASSIVKASQLKEQMVTIFQQEEAAEEIQA